MKFVMLPIRGLFLLHLHPDDGDRLSTELNPKLPKNLGRKTSHFVKDAEDGSLEVFSFK